MTCHGCLSISLMPCVSQSAPRARTASQDYRYYVIPGILAMENGIIIIDLSFYIIMLISLWAFIRVSSTYRAGIIFEKLNLNCIISFSVLILCVVNRHIDQYESIYFEILIQIYFSLIFWKKFNFPNGILYILSWLDKTFLRNLLNDRN